MDLPEIKNKKLIQCVTWYKIFNVIHWRGLWWPIVPIMIVIGLFLKSIFMDDVGDAVLWMSAFLYIGELPMLLALTRKAARSSIVKMKVNELDKFFLKMNLDAAKFNYTVNDETTYFDFVFVSIVCDLIIADLL